MKIAAASNTPVLSCDTDVKSDADENALRGTKVGRIDAQGQASADNKATASTTTTTARSAAVGTSGQLPRTASPLATLQLLSAGLIVSALGVRQLRRRYAANR